VHLALVVARFPTPEQLVLFRVRQKDSTGYLTGTGTGSDREGQPKPCTTPLSITEAVNPKAWIFRTGKGRCSLKVGFLGGKIIENDGVFIFQPEGA